MTNAVTPIEPLFPAHCQTVKSSIELCKIKLAKASAKEREQKKQAWHGVAIYDDQIRVSERNS
jgi:hypothetical protein